MPNDKPTRAPKPIWYKTVARLHAEGLDDYEIAKRMGRKRITVRHARHSQGLPPIGLPAGSHRRKQKESPHDSVAQRDK